MEEKWKAIIESNHYQVSNFGRIKSLGFDYIRADGYRTVCFERVLKTHTNRANGYVSAVIRINKKPKTFYVHRLVALAFINNDRNLFEINHKDGDKTNNRVDNLEWCTRSENLKHRFEVLKQIPNRRFAYNGYGSKPVIQKDRDGNQIQTFPSAYEASRKTGTNRSSLHGALSLKYKTANGFCWSYI